MSKWIQDWGRFILSVCKLKLYTFLEQKLLPWNALQLNARILQCHIVAYDTCCVSEIIGPLFINYPGTY